MRSIKFKAWDKKSKKMRIIDSIAFHGLGHFDIPTLDIKLINLWGYDIIEDKYFIIRRDPEQVKLLQFTGLYDKNGKEIYEQDILEVESFEGSKSVVRVVFDDGCFCHIGHLGDLRTYPLRDFLFNGSRTQVIGNIYEHPHLLEGSE